jgi:glucose/arabinose dehydrogenase
MRRRPFVLGVPAALVASTLLSGCGEPEPPSQAPSSASPSAPSSSPAGAASTPPGTAEATVPSAEATSAEALEPVELSGEPGDVATGLAVPWSVVLRDGVGLISERETGRILELLADGDTRTVGTVPGVVAIGESGLLGLAVDTEGRLYAYSTGSSGNRVQRFALSGEAGSLRLGSPVTILSGIPSAANHDGGRIAFGPDGMLYVGTGDAAQSEQAQDRSSLAGKILRLNPDGKVPADNPFPDSLVYSYGHRNVQGLAWTADGRMWATEFGQNSWDELNQIKPGGNYGWPLVEGKAGRDGYQDPVQQWHPARASPSGLLVVGGTLFIANLRGQVLREVPVAEPSTSKDHFLNRFGRIRAVALSPDGDLWFLTGNTDGRGRVRRGDDRLVRVGLQR